MRFHLVRISAGLRGRCVQSFACKLRERWQGARKGAQVPWPYARVGETRGLRRGAAGRRLSKVWRCGGVEALRAVEKSLLSGNFLPSLGPGKRCEGEHRRASIEDSPLTTSSAQPSSVPTWRGTCDAAHPLRDSTRRGNHESHSSVRAALCSELVRCGRESAS
jgi:hypothetical protein